MRYLQQRGMSDWNFICMKKLNELVVADFITSNHFKLQNKTDFISECILRLASQHSYLKENSDKYCDHAPRKKSVQINIYSFLPSNWHCKCDVYIAHHLK